MKITVLGCSGAEFPGSNAPAFLLNDEILFDAGSLTNVLDEKAQMRINYIFITHAHLDHIRGIPFLADNIIMRNLNHKVSIMSIPPVVKTIKKHLFNSAVWPDFTVIPHPDDAIMKLVRIRTGRPMKIDGYMITAYPVYHTVPAVGYLVEDREKRRFFYTGDTGPTSETWRAIGDRELHCLIIDVSFPNSMEDMAVKTGHLTTRLLERELSHMNPAPERIYITHPKPQYHHVIEREVAAVKLKNVRLLREGEVLTV